MKKDILNCTTIIYLCGWATVKWYTHLESKCFCSWMRAWENFLFFVRWLIKILENSNSNAVELFVTLWTRGIALIFLLEVIPTFHFPNHVYFQDFPNTPYLLNYCFDINLSQIKENRNPTQIHNSHTNQLSCFKANQFVMMGLFMESLCLPWAWFN